MVFEKAPVERVAPAASHEINLEIRLSKPRVGVELVGLDGHLLHVLDARLDKRLRSAAELHSAGCRNNAVNVVTRGGQRHPIPCRIAPVTNGARNDPGQLRDVMGCRWPPRVTTDRKSTRLNSSHGYISYAVFCLK